tara:strand:+ start:5305 stop:6447 length:1143 start_codon:yes stop_codon:yes gene_type:complete
MQEKKPLGRITLALILAAMSMAALSTEKFNEDTPIGITSSSDVVSTGPSSSGPVRIIEDTGVDITDSEPEAPPKALEVQSMEEGVQVLPSTDTGPEAATEEEASADAIGVVPEGIEEPLVVVTPWYTKVWDMLAADENSIKAKAQLQITKMRMNRKFGAHSSVEPNFTTLLEAQTAMALAAEIRIQKELAIRIQQDEQRRLYDESLLCLALNGYHEARGETADQEVATAAVVLNRLSVGFRSATTVCEVIYTPKQFSWVEEIGVHIPDTRNKIERQAWERSLLIARRMLDPDATYIDPSNGALYYYNEEYVREETGKDWKYAYAYKQVAILGNHRFMTEKDVSHAYHIDNRQVRINPVLFNGLTPAERNSLISEYQKVGA